MDISSTFLRVITLLAFTGVSVAVTAQSAPVSTPGPGNGKLVSRQKVIIDTDIGDDIDDVLAIGLALNSPELEIVGITSAWGDTRLRARMLDRLLREAGRGDIPVAVGIERHKHGEGAFTQARWAQQDPEKQHVDAVDFLLQQIGKYPGEITLVAIGRRRTSLQPLPAIPRSSRS